MSTRPEHDKPRDPGTPGEEHPHGLVREIREEIEHAVEHVPKPVRWTVRKLALLATLSVLVLVVLVLGTAFLYVSNRTEWVAKELTVFLNGTLAQRSDVTISIADVRGNPFREIWLIRPSVRFRTGDASPLLEAPAIQLKYSAWGLLGSGGRFVDVVVDSPQIRLTRQPDGRLRLPAWKAAGPAPEAGRGFDIRLRLKHGRLVAPGAAAGAETIDLDATVATGRATRVDIRRLSWKSGPYATRDLQLSGELTAGDSVRFVVRRLRTPDLVLQARGGWKKGSTARWIHADIEHLRWRWFAEAIDSRTFDVAGAVRRLVVDASGDHDWKGRFTTDLEWSGLSARGGGEFAWADERLRIEPLALETSAGILEGRAAWSDRAWEVSGTVGSGDPSGWAALGIEGWPEGILNGRFRYAVETGSSSTARLDASLGGSQLAGWRFDGAEVAVDFPPTDRDTFTVRMFRRGGEVTLVGESTEEGWRGSYRALELPLEEWPEGRASGIRGVLSHGEGTVAGREGELRVTGTLQGRTLDWLGVRSSEWRLDAVKGLLLPQPKLTGIAGLEDAMFLGVHFDSAGIDLSLDDQSVELNYVRAMAGDSVLTVAGEASWTEDGWRMTLDRGEFASRQFRWIAEPPVSLSGDARGVVFERLLIRDGAATVEMSGRWASPQGSYEWSARARRLDLSRTGMPHEWRLSGTADLALDVRGPAGRARWTFEAACSKPGWQDQGVDSLSVGLLGEPSRLEVRRFVVLLEGGSLGTSGSFEETATSVPDTLTFEGVRRWLGTAERWDGLIEARDLPLERLERLASEVDSWSGRASGKLVVEGSPARPVIDARVEARPISWKGYMVDDLVARAEYRDERLDVPELRVTRANLVSTAVGFMPLRLDLRSKPEIPEREMSWRLQVPNGDLSVLPLFVQQIGAASGKFEMKASVHGTPRHPGLDGYLRVRDGRLRPAGREEVVDKVYADCRLDESRVSLDSLSARQGDRGRLSAKGVVEVSGAGLKGYRFDLAMRDFTASETGVYAAQFDGDFRVSDGPRHDGQVLPNVEGTIELRRAVVLFDFANQSEVQRIAATTQPLFWTYRVQVNAIHNLRWQPPDGDIEFSANLTLDQSLEGLRIDGEMSALRGTYYFLSNRFNVDRANLAFRSIDGVNPDLDIQATTRVEPTQEPVYELGRENGGQRDIHVVTVRITGKSTEPLIELASDPSDWDEARILRELTVGRFYAGGAPLGDPLDNYLTRAINKTLSAEMSRAFHGYVSDWVLERERGGLWIGEGDVIIGFGSQITPNLLVRYRQRVPGLGREVQRTSASASPFERDIEAEYRINRFFYITSELTQRRTLSGGTSTITGGPDFNVNLKARWEY